MVQRNYTGQGRLAQEGGMKKVIKPAFMDPRNSVDLFDADRRNEFGEMFCVAPAILLHEVKEQWELYCKAPYSLRYL